MEKAIVLVSGGINSAVAAALARDHYEPILLHLNWGHRTAEREKQAFEELAAALDLRKTHIADLSAIASLSGGSRASKKLPIEDANALPLRTAGTFTPGLLPSMLGIAAALAAGTKAGRIILGINEDHQIPPLPAMSTFYPDYRREFVQAFNLMLRYALPSETDLIVELPLIDLSRAEIVRLGQRCNLPFEHTWSCYSNPAQPCRRCLGCTVRAAGFLKAGIPDPLMLEPATV